MTRRDSVPTVGARARRTPLVLPFSKDKVWSIVVVDEGPVEPTIGHFKYHWAVDHEPFRKWAEERGVTADQLTAPKLERLMKRLRGEPWLPLRVRPGRAGEEIAGNQLDYPEAERADVLLGLQAFAADDARDPARPTLRRTACQPQGAWRSTWRRHTRRRTGEASDSP